jgi:hypothetical protein
MRKRLVTEIMIESSMRIYPRQKAAVELGLNAATVSK